MRSMIPMFCFVLFMASTSLIWAQDGVITGTVYDNSTGLPLENVRAWVSNNHMDTTSVDGTYILPGLDAGTYTLTFHKLRYHTAYVTNIIVGEGDTVVVNYLLQPIPFGFIMGNVTDETAAPVESVYIFRNGGYNTYTDENGDYFVETYADNFNYTFQKTGFYDTTALITINQNDTTIFDMIMTELQPGIRGKVLNMHPHVVESVLVSVEGTPESTYTDLYGDFLIDGLDSGIYNVSFSHPLYIDTILTDIPAEPGLADSLEMVLTGNSFVKGHVFSMADSLPLRDVSVSAYPLGNLNDLTGVSGQYVLHLVPQRVYILRFNRWNHFEAELSNISVDVAETLVLDDVYMEQYSSETSVWYGNLDGSPITVPINSTIFIDLYCQAPDSIEIAFLHLPIATGDQYISEHLSETLGVLYYPLSNWDDISFLPTFANDPGWHSQSLFGFYDTGGEPNPTLNPDEPTRIATFAFRTADDPSLLGDTVNCFTEGYHYLNEGPLIGDISGIIQMIPFQHFSPLYFSDEAGVCVYTVGDVNGNWVYNGLDITYGVAFFKGGPPPPNECECTAGNTWYVAGDVNASCGYNGLDITYGVNYFKGGDAPQPCPDCPPSGSPR